MKKLVLLALVTASTPLYGLKIIVENYGKGPFKMDTWYDQCHAAGDTKSGQTNDVKIGYNEIIAKTDGGHQCWINKIKLYTPDSKTIVYFSKNGFQGKDSKDILTSAVYNGDLSDGVLKIVIDNNNTIYLIKNDVIFVKAAPLDNKNRYIASK